VIQNLLSLSKLFEKFVQPSRTPPLSVVVRNILWALVERGLQIVMTLIITGLIAREFGPELYGKWQYALSLLFIATTLTYLCGSEVVVPRLVANPERAGKVLGTAFAIRILISSIAYLIGYTFTSLFLSDPEVSALAQIILLLLFLVEPPAVIVAWLQSKTNIAPAVKIRLAALSGKFIAITAIAYFSLSYKLVAVAWVGEGLLVAILLFLVYFQPGSPKWQFSRADAFTFFKDGAIFWLGLLFMTIFLRQDRLFLAEHTTYTELGVYSAAIQITENWLVLGTILSQSFAPKYLYGEQSPCRVNQNIKKLLLLYLAIALSGSALLSLSSNFLITAIFGNSYADAVPLLQYAAFLSVATFVDSVYNALMLKEQAATWVVIKWATALTTASAINFFFIEHLGTKAPLIALFLGYGAACVVGIIYWIRWKKRVLPTYQEDPS